MRGGRGEWEGKGGLDLPYDALAIGACIKAALLQEPNCCFENPIQLRIHPCGT